MLKLRGRLGAGASVRAFLVEVLVIVLGVLIALGGQELVNEWTSRQRVAKGEALLRAEVAGTAAVLVEQIVTAPCIVAQIDRLKDALNRPGPWQGAPASQTVIGPAVIRAPSRPISSTAWPSLQSDGTAGEFASDIAARTSAAMAQQASLSALMDYTDLLRNKLLFLINPGALDPATRAQAMQILGELRWDTQRQAMKASQLLALHADLGRLPARALVEQEIAQMGTSSTIGACRAQGLPLAEWRQAYDAALAGA